MFDGMQQEGAHEEDDLIANWKQQIALNSNQKISEGTGGKVDK